MFSTKAGILAATLASVVGAVDIGRRAAPGGVLAGAPVNDVRVTSDNVVQCGQATISWTGATAPVTLQIGTGGYYVGTNWLTSQDNLYDTSFSWTVDQASSTDLIFQITDASGQVGYQQNVAVGGSDDSSCLGDSGVASAAASDTATTTNGGSGAGTGSGATSPAWSAAPTSAAQTASSSSSKSKKSKSKSSASSTSTPTSVASTARVAASSASAAKSASVAASSGSVVAPALVTSSTSVAASSSSAANATLAEAGQSTRTGGAVKFDGFVVSAVVGGIAVIGAVILL